MIANKKMADNSSQLLHYLVSLSQSSRIRQTRWANKRSQSVRHQLCQYQYLFGKNNISMFSLNNHKMLFISFSNTHNLIYINKVDICMYYCNTPKVQVWIPNIKPLLSQAGTWNKLVYGEYLKVFIADMYMDLCFYFSCV